MIRIFYHKSDLDGKCAGAIVYDYYKESSENVKLYGVDYNDHLLPSQYEQDDIFYVVDFSFDMDDMMLMHNIGTLIWIDHHKSAIEKLGSVNFKGLREIGKAGCELTWQFMHPDADMPLAVYYLGRYDVWDHSCSHILPFQYGMRQRQWLPDMQDWTDVLRETDYGKHLVKRTLAEGKIIHSYQIAQDKMYAKAMSYETVLWGHKLLIINKAFANSQIFDKIYDENKHDILVTWSYNGTQYKYSLFTHKDIDVSMIAKAYGGGGHQKAAGFYISKKVV